MDYIPDPYVKLSERLYTPYSDTVCFWYELGFISGLYVISIIFMAVSMLSVFPIGVHYAPYRLSSTKIINSFT